MSFYRNLFVVLTLALVAGIPTASAACSHVDLPSATVLPGGASVNAGRLSVCRQPDFSPSLARHTVRWNGMAVSTMMSQRGSSESDTSLVPFFTFSRDILGRLHLTAFAVPGGDGMDTFRPAPPRRKSRPVPATPRVTTEEIYLAAARD